MHNNLTMKQYYTIILLLFGITNIVQAQVNTTSGSWSPIGNVVISTVTDDADNGDGVGDGAMLATGRSFGTGQGAAYTFSGTMQTGQFINVSTYTYFKIFFYLNLVNCSN